jgi:hypothetical protein
MFIIKLSKYRDTIVRHLYSCGTYANTIRQLSLLLNAKVGSIIRKNPSIIIEHNGAIYYICDIEEDQSKIEYCIAKYPEIIKPLATLRYPVPHDSGNKADQDAPSKYPGYSEESNIVADKSGYKADLVTPSVPNIMVNKSGYKADHGEPFEYPGYSEESNVMANKSGYKADHGALSEYPGYSKVADKSGYNLKYILISMVSISIATLTTISMAY